MNRSPFKPDVIQLAANEGAKRGLLSSDVLGKCRAVPHVTARRAVWRALYDAGHSYSSIARMTGRHHTTVMHGLGALR